MAPRSTIGWPSLPGHFDDQHLLGAPISLAAAAHSVQQRGRLLRRLSRTERSLTPPPPLPARIRGNPPPHRWAFELWDNAPPIVPGSSKATGASGSGQLEGASEPAHQLAVDGGDRGLRFPPGRHRRWRTSGKVLRRGLAFGACSAPGRPASASRSPLASLAAQASQSEDHVGTSPIRWPRFEEGQAGGCAAGVDHQQAPPAAASAAEYRGRAGRPGPPPPGVCSGMLSRRCPRRGPHKQPRGRRRRRRRCSRGRRTPSRPGGRPDAGPRRAASCARCPPG
jgi:hypothetical protein